MNTIFETSVLSESDLEMNREDLIKEISALKQKSEKNKKCLDCATHEAEGLKKEVSRSKLINTEKNDALESLKNITTHITKKLHPKNELAEMKEMYDQECIELNQELHDEQTELKTIQEKIQPNCLNEDDLALNSILRKQVEDLNIKLCQLKEEMQQYVTEVQELQQKLKGSKEYLAILNYKSENIKTSLEEANVLKDNLQGELALLKIANQGVGDATKDINGKPNSLFQEVDEGRIMQQSNYNIMKEAIVDMINKQKKLKKDLQDAEMKSVLMTLQSKQGMEGRNSDNYVFLRAYQDSTDLLQQVKKAVGTLIENREASNLFGASPVFNFCGQKDITIRQLEKQADEEDYKNSNLDYNIFKSNYEIEIAKEKIKELEKIVTELNAEIGHN